MKFFGGTSPFVHDHYSRNHYHALDAGRSSFWVGGDTGQTRFLGISQFKKSAGVSHCINGAFTPNMLRQLKHSNSLKDLSRFLSASHSFSMRLTREEPREGFQCNSSPSISTSIAQRGKTLPTKPPDKNLPQCRRVF